MYNFEYKEKDYAEEILKKGFTSNHIRHELKILVKYFKEQGHKPKKRKELIYEFCEKYLEGFDRVTHFKMINSILNYGSNKKNKLVQIDYIEISNEELEYIDGLDIDHIHKKVVFTLLVLNKLNKIYNENSSEEHYFSGDYNYKKLVKYSNINLKKISDIHNIIRDLAEKEIVEIKMRSSIRLSFIYNFQSDDTVAFKVSTFNNIGLYYDLHVGIDKVKKCECCDTPIKVKSNRSKYCEDCGKEIEREMTKERVRKHRKM